MRIPKIGTPKNRFFRFCLGTTHIVVQKMLTKCYVAALLVIISVYKYGDDCFKLFSIDISNTIPKRTEQIHRK